MQTLPRLASRKAGLDNPTMIMLMLMRPRRTISTNMSPSAAFRISQRTLSHSLRTAQIPRAIQQRTIFSISRLPWKFEYQKQKGVPVQVKKVRFYRPRRTTSSMCMVIIACYVCYQVYARLVLDPLERAAMEALKNMSEEEIKEMKEDESKPLFIPFPGTTRTLKPKPYRGSDPEWQEFIKVSKDKNLQKNIRDELAHLVQTAASRHPVLILRAGKEMKIRRWWLDIDFPHHAPPEFERSGIEIGPGYIAWGTQTVDSLAVFRLRQALWPSALVQSFWSFTKVMVQDDAKHLAQIFGVKSNSGSQATNDQLFALHKQMTKGQEIPTKDGPPAEQKKVTIDPAKAIATAHANASEKAVAGKGPEGTGEEGGNQKNILVLIHAHMLRPMMAFKAKLAQTWRPAPGYPPKGCILVSGMVEIEAPKAWMVFDVVGAWDPKAREWDARSMVVRLRRLQFRKQGPVG